MKVQIHHPIFQQLRNIKFQSLMVLNTGYTLLVRTPQIEIIARLFPLWTQTFIVFVWRYAKPTPFLFLGMKSFSNGRIRSGRNRVMTVKDLTKSIYRVHSLLGGVALIL